MFALVHGSIFKASGNFPYARHGIRAWISRHVCLPVGYLTQKFEYWKYYLSLTQKLKANVCHTSVYADVFGGSGVQEFSYRVRGGLIWYCWSGSQTHLVLFWFEEYTPVHLVSH